jgi:serine/threonine protein kinase/formylglycine-generating enzyme required for sulfatase activity
LRRFEQEARAASALDHPNVCVIHEVGETADGRHFIVMEYVDGMTLREHTRETRIKLGEAFDIAVQIASALAAAHAAGIVHRDIKPENIMVRRDGYVKVLDFGIAKLIEQPVIEPSASTRARVKTNTGVVMGTSSYMSPEQVRGLAVDTRTDTWSLGVVIYEMVTGRAPFEGATTSDVIVSILERESPPITSHSSEVPAELQRIVKKALRKDPQERYQKVKDMAFDLKSLKQELEFEAKQGRYVQPELRGGATAERGDGLTAVETARQPAVQTEEIQAVRTTSKESSLRNLWRRASSPTGLIVIAAIIIVAFAGWFFWSSANMKWARAQLPRIEQLAQAQKYFEAYDLAIGSQKYLPDDPTISRLMPTISDTISVTTDPAGAQVYLKRFAPDESGKFPPRQLVGTTPINNLRVARGQYILYIEKDGYANNERTVSGYVMHYRSLLMITPPIRVEEKLFAADKMPDRMAFVTGGDYRLVAWARPTDARVRLDDYFVDKYEVSNQEYKEFINAGGYLKKQYWKYPFNKDGKTLPWEEAMKEFRDRTGLPGPRSWSSQNFPEGKGDHPVTDITWYEAAAFAAFKGKQLPTIFQWEKAARNGNVSPVANYMPWGIFYAGETLANRANFENNGPLPVSSSEFGMSPFGSYNMAGNVSEWCLNETSQGYITSGGAWGERSYTFAGYGTFPGFYSSNKLGFRCALNSPGVTGDQGAARIEIKEEIPVYTPSSDASFNNWLTYYRYDRTPLDPQTVEVKETAEWRREKIIFNGADGERAIAYLYLPKNFPKPLQVIHFVPALDVQNGMRSLPDSMEAGLAPFIKSGRAVFGVVIKGYIERLRPEGYTEPEPTTVDYRENVVNWITDLRRGLDCLETRNDVDVRRIAFYGPSSGASIGLILAAVENRYASVLLEGAGLRKSYVPWIAEANLINFASHIRATKLMVQGRYDEFLSLKTEAEPLYKLLPEPKRLVLYDGGHVPPFEFLVTTMNGWLDETLGPVKRE